jgi:sugar phosphate isomerase/epimerase
MKIAITVVERAAPLAPFVLRGPFADTIRQAGEIGFDAVELHIPDPSEVSAQEIKRACQSASVSVSSIGTGLAFVRDGLTLTSQDEAIRSKAIARLQAFIELAGEIGGVVIVGLIRGLVRDVGDRGLFEQALADALAACLPLAESRGVTLVLEAVNRYESDILNTIAECAAFTGRFGSEHLKVHIDTFHMNIEEADIRASIAVAGPQIGHVHIADSNRHYPGRGHYDFHRTIAALKDAGYAGALSVECLSLPSPDEAARGAQAFLRDALAG